MVSRVVDQLEIESLISTGESEKEQLEARLRQLESHLNTLYAVRDFVTWGPDRFRTPPHGVSQESRTPPQATTDGSGPEDDTTRNDPDRPPDGASVAKLVDYVLRKHRDAIRASGRTPGMRPAEIRKEIARVFQRKVDTKPINGRLWYMKSRDMIGWRDNSYFLKDDEVEASPA
jgi:hypothetical protein